MQPDFVTRSVPTKTAPVAMPYTRHRAEEFHIAVLTTKSEVHRVRLTARERDFSLSSLACNVTGSAFLNHAEPLVRAGNAVLIQKQQAFRGK